MGKKLLSLALIFVLLLSVVPCYATAEAPSLTAEAALLVNMDTGDVLYKDNSDAKMYPASTTKMMTCILALEKMDMSKYIIVDGNDIKDVTGDSLNLKDGESMNVGTMISAMMVVSANDAAVVLAKEMAGSVEAFADMMNAKAAEIGCTGTHFVNPNGLHDPEHYTTCEDLAKIAMYCMQNEVFRRIVARDKFTVPVTNVSDIRALTSTNQLLVQGSNYAYDGCIGIKTGSTNAAGGCLVSAATKGETTLLSIVMKSTNTERFTDSIELLDWGFASFKTANVSNPFTSAVVPVSGGKEKTIEVSAPGNILMSVPADGSEVKTELEMVESLKAPFEAGTYAGKLKVISGDEVVKEIELYTSTGVEKGGRVARSTKGAMGTILKVVIFIAIAFAILIVILAIYILYKRRQQAKRKAARAARRAKMEAQESDLRREWEKTYHNQYRDDL